MLTNCSEHGTTKSLGHLNHSSVKTQLTFVGFEELKRNVSMLQILERYGLLKQMHRGKGTITGLCPIHDSPNQARFRVDTVKNCWICYGDCRGGGSIIDFVSRKERIGVRAAALLIQKWFHIQRPAIPSISSTGGAQ
jgi:DNA primase